MKVEILTNSKFYDAVQVLNTEAKCVYKSPADKPYYEIWEVEKSDIQKIETVCMFEDVMFCYSNGANRGTPFEFLTIGGEFVIGWTAIGEKNEFDCLTDYFKDGLGLKDSYDVCACAVTLAKTNGWSMAQMFKNLEG